MTRKYTAWRSPSQRDKILSSNGAGALLRAAWHANFASRSFETVADPGFGVNVLRVLRIGLDLLPQLVDEDAQVFGFVAIIGAPHGLQEPPVRLRFSGVRNQLAEQLEFFGRELHGVSSNGHGALFEINGEVFGSERGERITRG